MDTSKPKKEPDRIMQDYYFSKYPGLNDYPEDLYNAYSGMWVSVGYSDQKGISTYYFHLFTIKKLEEIIKQNKFDFSRHTLIVEKFDLELIKKAIESILPEIEKYGDDVT